MSKRRTDEEVTHHEARAKGALTKSMSKRRTDEEVTRLLKDADRDLARGLTVSDCCRKVGVAQTTYHRWRKLHDPEQVDSDRRCRQLEVEIERLKRLVAELLLDKQMR